MAQYIIIRCNIIGYYHYVSLYREFDAINVSDVVQNWLLHKFIAPLKLTHRETLNECVFESCSTPNIYIVEFEDFESLGKFLSFASRS